MKCLDSESVFFISIALTGVGVAWGISWADAKRSDAEARQIEAKAEVEKERIRLEAEHKVRFIQAEGGGYYIQENGDIKPE